MSETTITVVLNMPADLPLQQFADGLAKVGLELRSNGSLGLRIVRVVKTAEQNQRDIWSKP